MQPDSCSISSQLSDLTIPRTSESYETARKFLDILGFTTADLKSGSLPGLMEKAEKVGFGRLTEQLGVGVPTLKDIASELSKPGRDPRDELPKPLLRTDIMTIEDLTPGMILDGTVRNVIDFGAFVDIGVHLDGLVHISELSDHFVKHPSQVVKVGDIVKVRVLEADVKRKRISLSMKLPKQQ